MCQTEDFSWLALRTLNFLAMVTFAAARLNIEQGKL